MQCAFENIGDLLIVMTVQRHLAPFLSSTRATITFVPTIICRPMSGLRLSTSMSFHLMCFARFLPCRFPLKSYHIRAQECGFGLLLPSQVTAP